jgi:lysozyme
MSPSDNQKRIAAAVALATAIAVPAEGLRQWAYNDTGGILTVCRGHTGSDVVKGKRYSLAQCDALMGEDMKRAVLVVEDCAPGLPANPLGAFGDIVYNEGETPVCDTKHSTLARLLKAGMIKEACLELPKWNKAKVAGVLVPLPGLTKRRNAEVALCMESA